MHRNIPCPFCQRRLRLDEEHLSREVRCPVCAETFVPGEAAQPLDPIPLGDGSSRREPAAPADEDTPRRRPIDRSFGRRRQKEPVRRSSRLTPWIVVGTVLLGLASVVGGVWMEQVSSGNYLVSIQDPDEPSDEVKRAFHRPGPLADAELIQELEPLFEELAAALGARDGIRAVAQFDLARMFDELTEDALPRQRPNKDFFVALMRPCLIGDFTAETAWAPWDRSEIKNIKKLPGEELVVIVRHHGPARRLQARWWLTGASGEWKVYDVEDLDLGVRTSVKAGLEASRTLAGVDRARLLQTEQTIQALEAFREAQTALSLPDANTAELKLKSVALVKLPPRLNAVRLMLQGRLLHQRGQRAEAVKVLEKAHQDNPDMPCLDLLRGKVLAELGQGATALKHLESYRALLGDDPALCRSMGLALRWLSRFKEAAVCYRKALDEDPKDANAFEGLLNSLAWNDERGDVPARFARLDNRREHFVTWSASCAERRDFRALEQMAEMMRLSDPDFAPVDHYLSLVRAWQSRIDEAVTLFKSAQVREKDAQKRKDYVAGFLKAMAGHGKAVAAYGVVSDSREAFRILANALKEARQIPELKLLVEAHARAHPGDGLLPFYRGEILVWESNYSQAEKAFAAGLLAGPDRQTLERFRASRVLARYHGGDAMSAYREIGPQEETFEQLAGLLAVDQDSDRLRILLAEHAKRYPRSKDLLRFRCRLMVWEGKVDEAVGLFKKVLAEQTQPAQRKRVVSEFLRDMRDANRAVEAYQSVADARQAFVEMAPALLNEGKRKELQRLLQAHRERQPDDLLLDLYAGQLYLAEKAWDRAVQTLQRGWKKAGNDLRPQFRWAYVSALYQAGQSTRAYNEVQPRKDTFEQLANLMSADGKGAELKQLIVTHRQQAPEDANLLAHEARAELLLKQPGRAIVLFQQAYSKQPEHLRWNIVYPFVRAMAESGQALLAYRGCPDKASAFGAAAPVLLQKKKTAELLQLLQEHGKTHADDPNRHFHLGELYLLRGDVRQAEHYFTAALRKTDPRRDWMYRNGLHRARVRAGKVVQTYQDEGSGPVLFATLAYACAGSGNPAQLEALIAAHRRVVPDDPDLPAWEVELAWLKKDHEAVCQRLTAQRATLMTQRWRWKFEGYLIRSLVRLKKTEQAAREAEGAARKKSVDRLLIVLTAAAQGDVKGAIAAVEEMHYRGLVQRCYADEDLGPLLRSEAFQAFRERFPEPKTRK